MKEVTVIGICDGDHEDKVRAAIERTITIDGSKPVMLDLCEPCDKIIENVMILMERGAVVKGSKRSPGGSGRSTRKHGGAAFRTSIPLEGPHICPDCGFESKSRGALGQHLSMRHSKGFKDYMIEN